MERLVDGRYKIERRIGSGSFGNIYLATNKNTSEYVAVKISKCETTHAYLLREIKIYTALQGRRASANGIPLLRWSGKSGEDYALVIDLLGPSLEELFNFCGRKFSLKTVLMLADQMLMRIEYVHARGYLHRDLTPRNFLMSLDSKAKQVYIIDFGLGKAFWEYRKHIPYSLPWQGLKATTRTNKHEETCKMKTSMPIEVLCEGLPVEFASYMHYCRSLRFDDRPDYGYLKGLFRDLFTREGFEYDHMFDWTILKYEHKLSQNSSFLSRTNVKRAAGESSRLHPSPPKLKMDEQQGTVSHPIPPHPAKVTE